MHARNDCIYFSKAHTCSVRYSTVLYGLVRFLCRFRTTFCARFRWCWPLDSRDVTPGDVVDIFCLLDRVLVVEFAAFFLFHQITSIVNVGKVSEYQYQFHICNTANFFTSQKSKRVNLPISPVLVLNPSPKRPSPARMGTLSMFSDRRFCLRHVVMRHETICS